MSKQALDILTKRLAEEIEKSKDYRKEVNTHEHRYEVNVDKIIEELIFQVRGLFENKTVPANIEDALKLLATNYVISLEERIRKYSTNSNTKVNVSIRKLPGGKGFIAKLVGKSEGQDVYAAIRTIRTGGSAPLLKLRDQVEELLTSQLGGSISGDKQENLTRVIRGDYSKENPNVRTGGLFQIGHSEEHAISVQRHRNSIRSIKSEDFKRTLRGLLSSKDNEVPIKKTVQMELIKLFVESRKTLNYQNPGKMGIVAVMDESSFRNLGKSSTERSFLNNIVRTVKNFIVDKSDFLNLPGSNSILDNLSGMLIKAAVKKTKPKAVKGKKINPKAGKTQSKASLKGKASTSSSSESVAGKGKAKPFMLKVNTKSGGTMNRSLLTILKTYIKKVVAENMILPRLQYRTGRFATSVDIVNVVEGTRGVPQVIYNYMHDPYDVFRMDIGNHLATPTRDPRFIIDLSIRQIAARFAINKLITRVEA